MEKKLSAKKALELPGQILNRGAGASLHEPPPSGVKSFWHGIYISLFERCSVFQNQTEIVGIAAGICTSLSLLPQLIKLFKEKKAEDISLFYLLILFVGLALWIWYGILREDIPIIVTNGLSLIINGIVIFLGIKYKRANSKNPG